MMSPSVLHHGARLALVVWLTACGAVPVAENGRQEAGADQLDGSSRASVGETTRPENPGFERSTPNNGLAEMSVSDVSAQLAPLTRQLGRALVYPGGISDAEDAQLRVRVAFQVDAQGHIYDVAITRPSGSAAFDAAVEDAFATFSVGVERLNLSSISHQGLRDSIVREGAVIEITGR